MSTLYVSDKTTRLYRNAVNDSFEFVLIYGDEVEETGNERNARTEVLYRGRSGWVKSNELADQHPMEVYFIDVGQGDAAFIVTPANRKILIDGGKGNEAFQFLVWKYRLDLPNAQPVELDLLVLTHADEDHVAGLVPIIGHNLISVKQIWHSGIARFAAGAHQTPLGDLAGSPPDQVLTTRYSGANELRGQNLETHMAAWRDAILTEGDIGCTAVDDTYSIAPFNENDITIDVLGPCLVPYDAGNRLGFRWFSTAGETINANSVVLRLTYKHIRFLFPGDVNQRGALHLLADPSIASQLHSDVLKAPHHGSNEFDPRFLDAIAPHLTVISSGEEPDHGHPREPFLAYVGKSSRGDQPLLFCTALNAQFVVDADAAAPDADEDADPVNPAMLGQARRRFKKHINGLVNVRTDGDSLYAAKRVAAPYQFVAYGPIPPLPA